MERGKMKDGEGAAVRKVWKRKNGKSDSTIFYQNLTHEHL